jgi:hypothetical protein
LRLTWQVGRQGGRRREAAAGHGEKKRLGEEKRLAIHGGDEDATGLRRQDGAPIAATTPPNWQAAPSATQVCQIAFWNFRLRQM